MCVRACFLRVFPSLLFFFHQHFQRCIVWNSIPNKPVESMWWICSVYVCVCACALLQLVWGFNYNKFIECTIALHCTGHGYCTLNHWTLSDAILLIATAIIFINTIHVAGSVFTQTLNFPSLYRIRAEANGLKRGDSQHRKMGTFRMNFQQNWKYFCHNNEFHLMFCDAI